MGCGTSSDVIAKINEQRMKIDDLIQMNEQLQHRINDLHYQSLNSKSSTDTAIDLTQLKGNIDLRLSKLEKTVEKIHEEMTSRQSERKINSQIKDHINHSWSLNFDKDVKVQECRIGPFLWNDLGQDSEPCGTPRKKATSFKNKVEENEKKEYTKQNNSSGKQKRTMTKASTRNESHRKEDLVDHDEINVEVSPSVAKIGFGSHRYQKAYESYQDDDDNHEHNPDDKE